MNDNLVGNVFFLANVVVAGLSAFLAVDLVDRAERGTFANIESPEWIIGVLALLMGYAVSSIFMSVFESAVTTVFVLWAEDPHGWQLDHPEHYAVLHEAWLQIYPEGIYVVVPCVYFLTVSCIDHLYLFYVFVEYNDGHGKQRTHDARV